MTVNESGGESGSFAGRDRGPFQDAIETRLSEFQKKAAEVPLINRYPRCVVPFSGRSVEKRADA